MTNIQNDLQPWPYAVYNYVLLAKNYLGIYRIIYKVITHYHSEIGAVDFQNVSADPPIELVQSTGQLENDQF